MEELQPLVAKHARHLLSKANVIGVGLGYKDRGGRVTGTKALVVLVSHKVNPSRLSRADWVPRTLSQTATDVIEVGDLRLLPASGLAGPVRKEEPSRTTRVRPACPGVSVGHYQVTTGTFGALVYDAKSGAPLLLSNNHVLANVTDGKDGRARLGDPVYQPGRYDGGTSEDTIAHLERYVPIVRAVSEETCPVARKAEKAGNLFLRLIFPGHRLKLTRLSPGENVVDAAVAALVNPDDAVGEVLGLGRVDGTADPEPGLKVVKSGRTSGITHGEVRLIGATLRIGLGETGTAIFSDQVVTTAMAEPGDSGSLVVTEDGHQAVGLLSAGSSMATVLSRMSNVLKLLDVTLGALPPVP